MEAISPEILQPIKKELDLMEKNINKEMFLKAGKVSDFMELELCWWDKYLHPAVLILSARMFDYNKPQVVTMACVVQFIHIASGIHYGKYDQRPGLPILIGDYFYAKFFSYLCDGVALEWLPKMAKVICECHEAGVVEVESEQEIKDNVNKRISILKKQANLLGTCGSFGVLATNGQSRFETALRNYGLNLGAALNLMKNKIYLSEALELIAEAKVSLRVLPEGAEKRILAHFLEVCQKGIQKMCLVG